MSFKKNIPTSRSCKRKSVPATSNTERKFSDDGPDNSRTMHQTQSTKKGIDSRMHRKTPASNEVFTRNMTEKRVRLELFMIEGEDGFENKSVRSQMTDIARRGDDNFRSWFYENGVSGQLPSSFEKFKQEVIIYCTNQGIESLRKFRDESWSGYLKRLRDFMNLKECNEEDIFEKLRNEYSPRNLQMIFYSSGLNLNTMIDRISQIEEFSDSEKNAAEIANMMREQSSV